MENEIHIGSRLSYGGSLCTVRFIGKIPAWDVEAYGVEWDDLEKGKHDGFFQGEKLFKCSVSGTGSFVKSTRKPDPSIDFMTALKKRYQNNLLNNDPLIQVSASKVIETYGADKISRKQSDLKHLAVASLNHSNIHDQYLPLSKSCGLDSLESLDLAQNLFASINSISNICHGLSSLVRLNLNGNRFSDFLLAGEPINQLKVLSISNTIPDPEMLKSLAKLFPNVEELNLANNFIISELPYRVFSNVKLLDLSYNRLSSIPTESSLPQNVHKLFLSKNCIQDIKGDNKSIVTLDISHNQLTSWEVYDKIGESYPRVTDLRVNDNALTSNDEAHAIALARWHGSHHLEKLDGVQISKKDIWESEIYFINKVLSKEVDFNIDCEFWKNLVSKHELSGEQAPQTKEIGMKKSIIHIRAKYNGNEKPITLLKDDSIQKAKGTIGRIFQVSSLPSRLYYFDKDLKRNFIMNDNYRTLESYGITDESLIHLVTKN